MGRIGEKLDIDFVVSTGDNFYDNGLTGNQDRAFVESFTQIYTANSLQKQWYSGEYRAWRLADNDFFPQIKMRSYMLILLDLNFLIFFLFSSAVLGNHDYRGNAEAQLSQQLRKIDSRWLCLRSFIVNAGG